MVSPEQLGQLTKVQERRLEMAGRIGQQAYLMMTKLHEKHIATLTAEQIETIANDERRLAEEKYIHESLNGRFNDRTNLAPGISVILRSNQQLRLAERLKNNPVVSSPDAPVFEPMPESGFELTHMRLANGWYQKIDNGVLFFTSAQSSYEDRIIGGENSFGVGTLDVVRIESDSGEFWQSKWLIYDDNTQQLTAPWE